MAIMNPPFALQNAGATHTAAGDRLMLTGLFTGGATGLQTRGGVSPASGSEFTTTQTGSPSMQVTVGSGICYVPGTQSGTQGVYACINDTNLNLTVTTAHGSLTRIDTIVARVYDTQYSGGTDACALEIIAGTASASPTAPTLPDNCLALYNITVGAAVTSIVNGNLSDLRPWATTAGGVYVVRNQTERDAITGHPVAYAPMAIRTDTGALEAKISGTWVPKSPIRRLASNQISSPALTANGIWNDFTSGQWAPITFTIPPSGMFTISIGAQLVNNTSTATTWVGYRLSGGLVNVATGASGAGGIGNGTSGSSREFTWAGGTVGASCTVTPQYQVTSGTSGSVTLGQVRVYLEP